MIETKAPPVVPLNGLAKTLSTARALGIWIADEEAYRLKTLDHERLARVPFRDFAIAVLTHLGRDLDSD